MDLTGALWAFLVAFVLVVPFVAFLRGRLLAFAAGATVVAVVAVLLEAGGQSLVGPVYGPVFVLVFLAPIIEELLKFGVSGATGKDYRSASGVGAGFAATENALSFLAAWGGSVETLALLIGIRAVTDPLLHITATTLGTLTWRGRAYGLPLAILLHMGWNASTLAFAGLDPFPAVFLFGAITLVVLGILVALHRSPSLQDALRGRPLHRFPWTVSA